VNRRLPSALGRGVLVAFLCLVVSTLFVDNSRAQGGGYERTFPQSKATIEKILKEMQFSLAGRLPVLDGFALPGEHPLDHYQRGYFQSTVQVISTPSGGSVVHVSTKVTAWYSDAIPSRSGYRLLTSNGRVEVDLLDQLAAELGKYGAGEGNSEAAAANPRPIPTAPIAVAPSSAVQPAATPPPVDSSPSAPMPRLPDTGGTFSSSLARDLASQQPGAIPTAQTPPADSGGLKAEAENLEEILKNQGHPNNLVAVKKSGTPVVATPSLTAKTLFLASAHDEFEMLDFTPDWVHVRISGLSRGWIWRNGLEMPDSIPNGDSSSGSASGQAAADLFHVNREETALFPGDWEPLRNKRVKIISVQKTDESSKDGGPSLKLEFAKSLLDKSYADLQKKADDVVGIVLIFDSADGGMIATTAATLQQWKAGKLSDAALWHQSYFDPPEIFTAPGPSASQ
jgi:hypothetical protein